MLGAGGVGGGIGGGGGHGGNHDAERAITPALRPQVHYNTPMTAMARKKKTGRTKRPIHAYAHPDKARANNSGILPTDDRGGWVKPARNLKAGMDEDRIEAVRGTRLLPVEVDGDGRVAVKIVDDWGVEGVGGIAVATASSETHLSHSKPNGKAKAVSLFSGCGGSDSGLNLAGFDVIFANDIMPYARDLYLANLPETDYQCVDIQKIKSFPKADLLVGCYPCQGFSQGGAREPDRKINYLYREFDRALRQIRPKAFIVENVSGMRRRDFAYLLHNQLTRFRLAGYSVKSELLNAVHFGVAQERQRVFIVGIRSDLGVFYEFPTPTHGVGKRKPIKTIADALSGLPDWPEGDFFDGEFHWYYMSRNRRRDWTEPSKTIVSKARHMPLHPVSPELIRVQPDEWEWSCDAPRRRFSFREAAILQGFRKNLIFPESGTLLTKYKVIGNAVPPKMFQAVAEALPDVW